MYYGALESVNPVPTGLTTRNICFKLPVNSCHSKVRSSIPSTSTAIQTVLFSCRGAVTTAQSKWV